MNIPTEYYEQEFLDFEDDMKLKGQEFISTSDYPHKYSDFILQQFHKTVKESTKSGNVVTTGYLETTKEVDCRTQVS